MKRSSLWLDPHPARPARWSTSCFCREPHIDRNRDEVARGAAYRPTSSSSCRARCCCSTHSRLVGIETRVASCQDPLATRRFPASRPRVFPQRSRQVRPQWNPRLQASESLRRAARCALQKARYPPADAAGPPRSSVGSIDPNVSSASRPRLRTGVEQSSSQPSYCLTDERSIGCSSSVPHPSPTSGGCSSTPATI